jgi:hypothetical protein
MLTKYFGMRFVVPSGGSFKVTIPKEIVEEVWRRRYNEFFPVCFVQMDERLIAEDIEKIVRKDYPDEVITRAKQDLEQYGLNVKAKKDAELMRQFLEGKIPKERYLFLRARYEESFQKIIEKFREALKERGLHFLEIRDFEDMLFVLSSLEEKEKDEELLMLLDDIKRLKEDVESVEFLLKLLDKSWHEGKIDVELYDRFKTRYEEKLSLAKERVNKLRDILC